MVYRGKLRITKDDYDYYNKLLDVNLYDENNEVGRKDDYVYIGGVLFSNGNYFSIDLASGDSNYYDNCMLYDRENGKDIEFTCNFVIDNMEFDYNGDKYYIDLEVV